jgi:hypothetical protein
MFALRRLMRLLDGHSRKRHQLQALDLERSSLKV